jgi:Family of unknown function (DUF5906)
MAHNFEYIRRFLVFESREGKKYSDLYEDYLKNEKNPVLATDIKEVERLFAAAKKVYPNFEFVQAVLNLHYIKDANTGRYYLVDDVTKVVEPIEESAVRTAFTPKAFKEIEATRLYSARISYNPYESKFLFKEGLIPSLNMYRPAEWQVPYFMKGKPVPESTMPKIYDEFLKHLTINQLSYDYCLAFWAATVQSGFKPQNYCVLIGIPGLGKGVFYQILSELVGNANAGFTNAQKISDTPFNGWAKNKKILFFDELCIRKPEDENILKPYVGPEIEIEEKGVDKKTYVNYASIMLATNDIGELKLQEGDRRFCFVDTGAKSLETMVAERHPAHDIDSYVKSVLLNKENIKQLGEFLLNFKFDKKLLTKVLPSEIRKTFKEDTTSDYVSMIFAQIAPKNAGKVLTIQEANEQLQDISRAFKYAPGIRQWTRMALNTPGYFKIRRVKDSEGIVIPKIHFEDKNKMPQYFKEEKD